jgi:hypothetical protein
LARDTAWLYEDCVTGSDIGGEQCAKTTLDDCHGAVVSPSWRVQSCGTVCDQFADAVGL